MTKDKGDKPVGFRVFLDDEERTEYKVACIKLGTNMSDQAITLIREWLHSQKNASSSDKGKGAGD